MHIYGNGHIDHYTEKYKIGNYGSDVHCTDKFQNIYFEKYWQSNECKYIKNTNHTKSCLYKIMKIIPTTAPDSLLQQLVASFSGEKAE